MNKVQEVILDYRNAVSSSQKNLIPTLISIIVFTKFFYKSNQDLKDFTENYLSIKYKEYLFKSRTLLYSRIIKDFYISQDNVENMTIVITKFLNDKLGDKKNHLDREKINNQSEVIDAWRKIINPDD